MKTCVTLIVLLLIYYPANCCLNLYGEDVHGGQHLMEHRHFRTISFNEREIKKNLMTLNKKINSGLHNFKDLSDYGVWMLMAGKYADGLALYRELIKEHPGDYNIIQNLGTAHELNGMPDSAFFYIKKGYLLNPKSHRGSEWLHVRYLENLLSKQEINYTKNIFLDTVAIGSIKNEGQGTPQHYFELDEVLREINYQLDERIPFTLGKDDLLAKLLTETGDLYAEKLSVTRAHLCYLYAQHFNSLPEAKTLLQDKIGSMVTAIRKVEQGGKSKSPGLPREYHYALENYGKLATRKPVNTGKWTFIPVETLIKQLKRGF
jgi:tetratricopeptide (TPR) repeat protein